jgi:hypothetical protein
MSEAGKEIWLIHFLLKGDIKLLIIFKRDNVGAISVAENSNLRVRTRHIDTRYPFSANISKMD